jgi:hypothetical protein
MSYSSSSSVASGTRANSRANLQAQNAASGSVAVGAPIPESERALRDLSEGMAEGARGDEEDINV